MQELSEKLSAVQVVMLNFNVKDARLIKAAPAWTKMVHDRPKVEQAGGETRFGYEVKRVKKADHSAIISMLQAIGLVPIRFLGIKREWTTRFSLVMVREGHINFDEENNLLDAEHNLLEERLREINDTFLVRRIWDAKVFRNQDGAIGNFSVDYGNEILAHSETPKCRMMIEGEEFVGRSIQDIMSEKKVSIHGLLAEL